MVWGKCKSYNTILILKQEKLDGTHRKMENSFAACGTQGENDNQQTSSNFIIVCPTVAVTV